MTESPPLRALRAGRAAVDPHRHAVGPRDLWVGLRRALRDALRLNLRAFSPGLGARAALGVVIALVIGKAVGDPGAEASMAAGALLAGVPGVVNNSRTSLRSLLSVAVAMAVSTFVGSFSGELGWVHTAVLVPWCLAAGLLVGLGGVAISIGTQSIAAMIVFGRFAEQPVAALHLAAFVLAGGLIAVAVVGGTRAPVTSALQRRAIGAALDSLAELARAGRTKRRGVVSGEALETAAKLVADAVRFDADESTRLRALLGVARRSRLELLAIEGLGRQLSRLGSRADGDGWAEVEEALDAAGSVFATLGTALVSGSDGGAALEAFAAADLRAQQALGTDLRGREDCDGHLRQVAALVDGLQGHLSALAGQLRAGSDLVRRAAPGRRPGRSPSVVIRPPRFISPRGMRETFGTLRAHASLRSPVGRHALRLAIVVTGAEALARHTPLQRGYWVALTASVVLRPDFSITFSRGLARVLGTSIGVILAGLLVIGVHSVGVVEIVAIGVMCFLACASFQVGYVVFTGFLTGLVVLLVGIVEPGTFATALDRLVDTLVGGFLALAVYGLWPTWSSQRAPQSFAALAERQRSYLGAVLGAIGTGALLDGDALRRLAREARRAKAEADDAVVRSAEEPEGHRFSLDQGQGIVAALGRISLAGHALRADLEAGRPGRFPRWATSKRPSPRGCRSPAAGSRPWPGCRPGPWERCVPCGPTTPGTGTRTFRCFAAATSR